MGLNDYSHFLRSREWNDSWIPTKIRFVVDCLLCATDNRQHALQACKQTIISALDFVTVHRSTVLLRVLESVVEEMV
jgi:hypothetical protein